MTKTALILGANGRFGRAAMAAFTDAGWQTTALMRPGKAQGRPNVVEADASDASALVKAAKGFDVIVNALNPPYDKWAEMLPSITEATIAAARASGATLLVPGNVYNYGQNMPEMLSVGTPQIARDGKGRLRVEMENTLRTASDIRVIILRGGDYIERRKTGNWFDSMIMNKVDKGIVTYPGPLDVVHAWAYLPDMARAAVGLCEIRETLPRFADIPFGGFVLTGAELVSLAEEAVGSGLKIRRTPWVLLSLLGRFVPVVREVVAMRYLWNRPHRLDNSALESLLPEFRPTAPEKAIRGSLTL